MNKLILFHGSEFVIQKPKLSLGKKNNDYGQGFYCTEDFSLANEWACKNNIDGFANKYELNLEGLKILDLRDKKYSVLHWICILVNNRMFKLNSIMIEAKKYLDKHYKIDLSQYDVVIGYRADDSYFDYAKSFLNNTLSLENLEKALILGKLGIQYALISEKSFSQLTYIDSSFSDCSIFYKKFYIRDLHAREKYSNISKNNMSINDTYIFDLIRRN